MRNKKEYRRNKLRARLSFDEGLVERPIYSIKAETTEKRKGLAMVQLIFNNFNLTLDNYIQYIEEEQRKLIEEINGMERKPFSPPTIPKLHRDEKGNLASPFRTKKKYI